jgi:hypothetical protein
MNIKEVRDAKRLLQLRLQAYIQDEVKAFADNTGAQVSHIDVSILQATEIGAERDTFVVGKVNVTLDV